MKTARVATPLKKKTAARPGALALALLAAALSLAALTVRVAPAEAATRTVVEVLDAGSVCEDELRLFTDAPEPVSSSLPFDTGRP